MSEYEHQYSGPDVRECVFCCGQDFSLRFLGPVAAGVCEVCLNKLVKDALVAQGRWPY